MKNLLGILLTAFTSLLLVTTLSGCASDMQPTVQSGATFQDKTLSGNAVDLLTLIRVENHYGSHVETSSDGLPMARSYK